MCGLCGLVLLALLICKGLEGKNIRRKGSSNLIEDVVVVGEDILNDICIVG